MKVLYIVTVTNDTTGVDDSLSVFYSSEMANEFIAAQAGASYEKELLREGDKLNIEVRPGFASVGTDEWETQWKIHTVYFDPDQCRSDRFAEVVWCVEDVMAIRPDMTQSEAEEWLLAHERDFTENMIEHGNEVLGLMLH